AALVLDGELELEARLGGAAQLRQLRRERELGRQIGRQRHRHRKRGIGRGAAGVDRQGGGAAGGVLGYVEAQLEGYAAVGRRERRRHRLAVADQRRGPARRNSSNRQREPLRRQAVILQLEIDRRGGSRPQRDRGVIGQQEQPFDVALGLLRLCCNAEDGEGRKHSRQQGDNTISHDERSTR